MRPYEASFQVGSRVKVADVQDLKEFQRTWKYHSALQPQQLPFAGQTATVESVGFYHGGDPLYVLKDVPGVWHEPCLRPASGVPADRHF